MEEKVVADNTKEDYANENADDAKEEEGTFKDEKEVGSRTPKDEEDTNEDEEEKEEDAEGAENVDDDEKPAKDCMQSSAFWSG